MPQRDPFGAFHDKLLVKSNDRVANRVHGLPLRGKDGPARCAPCLKRCQFTDAGSGGTTLIRAFTDYRNFS